MGQLFKLRSEFDHNNSGSTVDYYFSTDSGEIYLNDLLGEPISLKFSGKINCHGCGIHIIKSYGQGYCFNCFKSLAQCDLCIVKPELCHYHLDTCREPRWGDRFCNSQHILYLANSSGPKVGITREGNIPTRWVDQGAIEGLPIVSLPTRINSGLLEVECAKLVADKTNWRKMLSGADQMVDLFGIKELIIEKLSTKIIENNGEILSDDRGDSVKIHYPILEYPQKINSLSLDKQREISGILNGVKGQYLILDIGVINIRKFSGYDVELVV